MQNSRYIFNWGNISYIKYSYKTTLKPNFKINCDIVATSFQETFEMNHTWRQTTIHISGFFTSEFLQIFWNTNLHTKSLHLRLSVTKM